MALTPEAVSALLDECLLRRDEVHERAVYVEGIVVDYGFHAGRIDERAGAIGALLAELPDEFQSGKGSGWSFLCVCNDRHGIQWTDLHQTMEALVCLGIAAGKARWFFRDIVGVLHGGMPYVVIDCSQRDAST